MEHEISVISVIEKIKNINQYRQEYWSARELFKVLDNQKWDKFLNIINKAIESCKKLESVYRKPFYPNGEIGSITEREVIVYLKSSYACYLIV